MNLSPQQAEFVLKLYPAAERCEARWHVPKTISLGQALHESWRQKTNSPSRLAVNANNFWGIKAFKSWKGETVVLDTFEFIGGKKELVKRVAWRKYPDPFAAFEDYGGLLHGQRYFHAFDYLPQDLATLTEEQEDQFLSEIAKSWATDPIYARQVDKVEDMVQADLAVIMAVLKVVRVTMAATRQALRGGP